MPPLSAAWDEETDSKFIKKGSTMSQDYDGGDAHSRARDIEVYPVRMHERQPNFILLAVMACAIFLMLTSYLGK